MKIYVRALVYGDIILEEFDASPVQGFENCAIVHLEKRWVVYDIPTGLLIVYGRTRRECLENLMNKKLQLQEARKTELYQRRIKEFEEMRKL